MNELPQIEERVRVWLGPDFVRTGTVIDRNEYQGQVLVEFDYNIPNEWVRESRLC